MSKTVVQIGPYKLGKTLGVGSFSKVKKALHIPTGRRVAIKILNRSRLDSMDMGNKVRREIDILRLFNHPHIIRLYEVIETASDIFVVMEYVSGGELFDYIVSHGRLEEDEARAMFQQIISGVEYCHTHMVVHRDLKPENLLLDHSNNVRIADFGLSNIMRDGFFLKTSCGSPNYAAPEVISGNLYAGPEVDVWSCGVILYALLCGSLPFDDENIPNLFRKIKGGVYNMPSYLSDQTQDLIPRMLAVDPIKRISIAEIRQHPWFLQNLSPYLSLSATETIKQTSSIDKEAVEKVVKMSGNDREKVLQALEFGADLLTNNTQQFKEYDHKKLQDMRQMAVAYHLLIDQKDKLQQADASTPTEPVDIERSHSNSIFFANQSPSSSISSFLTPMNGPNIGSGSSFEDVSVIEHLSIKTPYSYSSASLARTPTQWYLGLWTSCPATEMMKRIFQALKDCQFEWKMVSPYKIKARYIPSVKVYSDSDGKGYNIDGTYAVDVDETSASQPNTSRPRIHSDVSVQNGDLLDDKTVKLGIQLYSVTRQFQSSLGGERKRYKYVVDIQKLVGEMFPFMDLCAKLVQNLQLMQPSKPKQKSDEVLE